MLPLFHFSTTWNCEKHSYLVGFAKQTRSRENLVCEVRLASSGFQVRVCVHRTAKSAAEKTRTQWFWVRGRKYECEFGKICNNSSVQVQQTRKAEEGIESRKPWWRELLTYTRRKPHAPHSTQPAEQVSRSGRACSALCSPSPASPSGSRQQLTKQKVGNHPFRRVNTFKSALPLWIKVDVTQSWDDRREIPESSRRKYYSPTHEWVPKTSKHQGDL